MQFVKAGRYGEAIRFLAAVIAQYRLDPVEEFCAGQIAIKEVLRLHESYEEQISICGQARSARGFCWFPASGLAVSQTSFTTAQLVSQVCAGIQPHSHAILSRACPASYCGRKTTMHRRVLCCVMWPCTPAQNAPIAGCAGSPRELRDQGHRPTPHSLPVMHTLQLLQSGAAITTRQFCVMPIVKARSQFP